MRFIRDIYAEAAAEGRPVVSFEFFTPKTDAGEDRFFAEVLPELAAMKPDYCSVTYGAGGSTQQRTFAMVGRIQEQFGIPAMAHLTCVGAKRSELRSLLEQARADGIRNILALRGDPPQGSASFQPPPEGFRYAAELVNLIREVGGFSIGVAGFPEGHQENPEGKLADWRYLRDKILCGADFVLTQLFFDNAYYREFRDYLRGELGVRVPLVPGIIPIQSVRQIQRFTAMCGATIPKVLEEALARLGEDDQATAAFGVRYAVDQCRELLAMGVEGLHFYTLNKAGPTRTILQELGLRPAAGA